MMIQGVWDKVKEELSEAVFPSNIYCIGCGSMIDRSRPYSLCDSCMKRLQWIGAHTCEKCGKALPDTYTGLFCYDCMTYEHVFTRGYSCMTYGFYERSLILDYKYNGRSYMAEKLGDILYDRISCEELQIDVIIPVPISRKRMVKRGYNQSALMARHLGKRWGKPVDETTLVRKKDTGPMRSLAPAEREAAVSDAFSVAAGGVGKIRKKNILLVDDIYTTGTTADGCSAVLMKSGAKDVFLLTLASGGNRKPNTV